ncbi:MAG: SRPBCC family protein [Acidobacteriota bacterium]
MTIRASAERCFDEARSIDLHVDSMSKIGERAVAGRTSGLIESGESVTWEAKHFGVRQRLTSQITRFDRPAYFRDTMTKGAFAALVHDHFFHSTIPNVTEMRDVVTFRSPFGLLGQKVDRLVMRRYLANLIAERQRAVRTAAEGR